MARKRSDKTPDSPENGHKESKPIIGALLAVILGVAMFYGGAQYYTAKRSTTLTAIASAIDEDGITLYRLPSGAIDKYAPSDEYSPLIEVPLAPSYSVKDALGKSMKPSAFYVSEGSERAVTLTVNPQGKICRIRELEGFFSIEGAALVKDIREMDVEGKSYFVGGTLFMSSGSITGKSGEELEGSVETGDTVKVLGYTDQALVVDVVKRAGRLSVSSTVDASRVYVDGVLRGKTPLVVSCAPGTRSILVRADGYRDDKGSVDVSSMHETKYSATLEEITGTLNISSTPPGASVYVGDVRKGTTPLKVAVTPGRQEVRFELDGYYSKTEEVIVAAEYEQAVSGALVRMAGSVGTAGGGASESQARNVTVVSSSPSAMTFVGMYPAGYVDTFSVTPNTTVDGWAATKATLERLLPGEEVSLTLAPDGSIATMSKTYSHAFTLKDQVQAKSGASLFLGSGWVECSLAWDAVIQDAGGRRYMREISPGDTVTVHGASPSDVRFVRVEETLGEASQVEGHLVSTPQGPRLFGDSYIIGVLIPQGLRVADIEGRATVPISQVPSGSRVRFRISQAQETVWAEMVWRANVSASGPISVLNGTALRVAALWDDLTIGLNTVIYNGSSRTAFYNLAVGDSVLAAGPSERDIRFIWVQDKALYSKVIDAVVASLSVRQEKAFYEITPSGLGAYPLYVSAQATFGYPAAKKTVRASELQAGDRVRLWVDEQRQVIWGEVTDKTDTRASGVYLGVKDGFSYLSGFQRFNVRNDLIITGLAGDEVPEPGSEIQVAGTGSVLSYMEVRTDLRPERQFKGMVLSSEDLLRIKGNWLYEEFPFAKGTWFVDWELMRDGPVSQLFPGDKVTVTVDIADEAMFVERTYCPPFKFEGTIEARQGRILVVTDKVTTKTIELTKSVLIYKDGVKAGISDLAVGDKVRVSGEGKNDVDVVVSGW